MTTLIHFGVRVLDIIFAVGLVGSVFVLILTGIEDLFTIFGKSPEEPRARRYSRAAHQSTATPARIL
jgi:hypothetical protein